LSVRFVLFSSGFEKSNGSQNCHKGMRKKIHTANRNAGDVNRDRLVYAADNRGRPGKCTVCLSEMKKASQPLNDAAQCKDFENQEKDTQTLSAAFRLMGRRIFTSSSREAIS